MAHGAGGGLEHLLGGGGGSPAPELTDEQLVARLRTLRNNVGEAASRGTSYDKFLQEIDARRGSGSLKLSPAEAAEAKAYVNGLDKIREARDAAKADRTGGNSVNFTSAGNRVFFTGPRFSKQFEALMKSDNRILRELGGVLFLLTLLGKGVNKLLNKMGISALLPMDQRDAHLNALKKVAKEKGYTLDHVDEHGASFYDKDGRPVDASELLGDVQNMSNAAGYRATTSAMDQRSVASFTGTPTDPAAARPGASVSATSGPSGSAAGASTASPSPAGPAAALDDEDPINPVHPGLPKVGDTTPLAAARAKPKTPSVSRTPGTPEG